MAEFIPVCEPFFYGNERSYVNECLDTSFISGNGPFVDRFENAFAKRLGIKHAIAVNTGTAALETAFYAIGLSNGDEVIMPSFTIISCGIAVLRLGGIPVFVDIDPEDWNMDVSQVEQKISPKTKAILAVDIYGSPVDYDPLLKIAKKYNLIVVEDFAESQGAQYLSKDRNKKIECGCLGDISVTSFYANKLITSGEGGMVFTENETFSNRAKEYRNLCFLPNKRFYHEELGHNFRMPNISAAIGLAQFEKLDDTVLKKKALAEIYRTFLENHDKIKFHPIKNYSESVYWMYCVELRDDSNKVAEVCEKLHQKGVGTRPFFIGLHNQPAILKATKKLPSDNFPNTDKASRRGFYLPSGIGLSEEQIKYITNALIESLN